MSRFSAITDNPHENRFNNKVGVLVTNLGSPDDATTPALRIYLREFLSDPRIVEIPRVLWMIILHGIILRVRPSKSAQAYKSIWTEDGSPLINITKKQCDKLQKLIEKKGHENVEIVMAMRYGNPSIESGLEQLREKGITNIVVLPLYPQYSSATTGSTFDAVSRVLTKWRWVPQLHFLNGYHDQPKYIESLSNSVSDYLENNPMPDKILFSYHGTPKQFLLNGDPYHCFCHLTTNAVVSRLGLDKEKVLTTFQSRFGKAEWLKPYTDFTLKELAKDGTEHVAILSPAFSADCLETLEELEEENKEYFIEAGGKRYDYIPALNDRDDHIEAFYEILKPHL
ncbi:ferrochelatase [Pseudoalteromonas luteoviolacea]|uniref:Ferrochelatase n=1 Tax=Pseudoalteromonas luteoviolacea DSM 6061 TaxID=1365250 RepID=A0A166VW15_9GAMM|nr:ferrochelatase [Pseudoalteromonas luteoviolacea]KZN33935.1 ferrochelatase [Pseudoalteromonas luteoviolacea DSM 6061]KZN53881.1 ferrochelatase [Pseudoalteromonas luteoviolacea CPMOR-2]MBE0385835.1 ferrochelatase [Pseudoalteromonas luteoviolacea DSM 6061]TQF70760.1 ferrochelatase [Pseudoalteromonas luteoviolacea]